jgi:hypothetical protein
MRFAILVPTTLRWVGALGQDLRADRLPDIVGKVRKVRLSLRGLACRFDVVPPPANTFP